MQEDYVIFDADAEKKAAIASSLGFSRLNLVVERKDLDQAKAFMDGAKENGVELKVCLLSKNKKDTAFARSKGMESIYLYDGTKDVREIITGVSPDILACVEHQQRDFIHHRASGLNQVSAKLLKENGIALGLSLGFLTGSRHKALVMGRMQQNVSLAKKYGFQLKIFSMARSWSMMSAPKDMLSLLYVMGADQKIAKKSLEPLQS